MCDVMAWLVISWVSVPGALGYSYEHFTMLPQYDPETGAIVGYLRSGYSVGMLDASTTEALFGVYELPRGATEYVNIHACGDPECLPAAELPMEIMVSCGGPEEP
jgi:hypothetical protein